MSTQKRNWMIAMGVAVCLLVGATSFAAVVNPGDIIQFSSAPGRNTSFSGGAFEITDSTSHSSWYTFCLEYNEHISFGTNYVVDTVGPAAVKGGVSGGNPDPISSQTAYLYYNYTTGGISGLSGAGTGNQQKALQYVIWKLEGEISSLPTLAQESQSVLDFITAYMGIANSATPNQYYGVRVVNPVIGTTAAQSQLVYVPEAGALLLFGTGLVGFDVLG